MFTGLITAIGDIRAATDKSQGRLLTISAPWPADSLALGASVAHNGVCLTLTSLKSEGDGVLYDVEVAAETLSVTTLGSWQRGDKVNLERPLKVGDELGGHIVLGHVDGVAEVIACQYLGEALDLTFRPPRELNRFLAPKGSVTLNGTSLTINRVTSDSFSVLLIPHTQKVTTWNRIAVADRVNIEIDQLARYASRLLDYSSAP